MVELIDWNGNPIKDGFYMDEGLLDSIAYVDGAAIEYPNGFRVSLNSIRSTRLIRVDPQGFIDSQEGRIAFVKGKLAEVGAEKERRENEEIYDLMVRQI